jgi:hypothetical protein
MGAYLENTHHTIKRAGGMAEGKGPNSKHQYCKLKKRFIRNKACKNLTNT